MAVYTEVSDAELEAFLAEYDIGEARLLQGHRRGRRELQLLLHTDSGSYILTLYEKRVEPRDLPFFLGLMEHLAERGITCPLPVHAPRRQGARALAGRPAAIDHLPRRHVAAPHDRRPLRARSARRWPRCTWPAATFALSAPNALSVAGWRPLFERLAHRADEVEPGLAAELDGRARLSSKATGRAAAAGVIHADLFPDNVFFLGDRLSGLIDFYFACNDFFAYDVAICLNAWCFEKDSRFNITKGGRCCAGYGGAAARRRRDAGAADAGARRGAALPADAALRLAEHADRRAGQPQGPARISAPSCASIAASALDYADYGL